MHDAIIVHSRHYVATLINNLMDLQRRVAEIEAIEEVLSIPMRERYQCDLRIKK